MSKPEDNFREKIRDSIDYLYKIDGDVTKEQYLVIDRLRQLINEEFVKEGRQVSNQFIYDQIKEILI